MISPIRFAALFSLILLAACGFVYDKTLVGRYKLVAVDVDEQMGLCWSLSNGSCEGMGPSEGTVVLAGFNDGYVVAAADRGNGPPAGKSATQFYYIIRSFEDQSSDDGLPYKGIRGPFTRQQYAAEKSRLHLPEFTWRFEDR